MKQHKWHKEIKAWADGEQIQERFIPDDEGWINLQIDDEPFWNSNDYEYRIKPQPKEPKYLYVYQDVSIDANNYIFRTSFIEEPNIAIYIGKIKLEVDDE